MRYKALILDLDGTTIPARPDGIPSRRVRIAVARAQQKIPVCVSTSRPLFFARPVLEALRVSHYCAVNDATEIYDPKTKRIIQTLYIDDSVTEKIVSIFEDFKVSLLINDGKTEEKYTGTLPKYSLCAVCAADLKPDVAEAIIERMSSIPQISAHKVPSHTKGLIWVAVTNALATKLHSVLTIAELLHVDPRDCIGVGDGYNDYPLLSACGLKIAMGNAVPELKAIADFIAPPVDEDGVAVVIEKFILNPLE